MTRRSKFRLKVSIMRCSLFLGIEFLVELSTCIVRIGIYALLRGLYNVLYNIIVCFYSKNTQNPIWTISNRWSTQKYTWNIVKQTDTNILMIYSCQRERIDHFVSSLYRKYFSYLSSFASCFRIQIQLSFADVVIQLLISIFRWMMNDKYVDWFDKT